MYLQATEEVPRRHEFERLLPGGRDTVLLRVDLGGVEPPLEKQQHAVHDAHDEMRRAAERPHSGNVRRLDGLRRGRRRGETKEEEVTQSFVDVLIYVLKVQECGVFVKRQQMKQQHYMDNGSNNEDP